MNKDDFLKKVENLLEVMEGKKELTDPDLWQKLVNHLSGLQEQFDKVMNTDRALKLGIVGRVKAGKSSFLNALLFEGQDRLPRAATPMTAALTRINYAPSRDAQQARVHYYTAAEWKRFERQSSELAEKLAALVKQAEEENKLNPRFMKLFVDPKRKEQWAEDIKRNILSQPGSEIEALKNSDELVKMARKNRVTHKELPRADGNEDEHCVPLGADQGKAFFHDLDEFVGAHGKYTPFVKYIELQLHDERLRDIEVVDTPGLNDPVSSRVDVTYRFLRECDVVLLLSNVSRFLDANDAVLVSRQIREASIKRAYIVGTMLDAGLMECPRKDVTLHDAFHLSVNSYTAQASRFLSDLQKTITDIPAGMNAEDGPQLVSSMFYAISRKMRSGEDFNEEEKHVLGRLEKLFRDYSTELGTADDFETASGFGCIKSDIYEQIRAEKDEILQERVAEFQKEQTAEVCRSLDDIAMSTERRKNLLENNDIAALRKKKEEMESNLQRSRIKVRDIFDETKAKCKKIVETLLLNMHGIQTDSEYTKINVETETKQRVQSEGIFFKEYFVLSDTIHKAGVTNVTTNIRNYGQECQRLVSTAFGEMFDSSRMERQLREAIYDTFRTANADAEEVDIRGPVMALLDKIAMPKVDFSGIDDAVKAITDKFSGEVTGSEIERLKAAQEEQLSAINKNCANKVERALVQLCNTLDTSGSTFVDDISKRVKDAYEKLEKQCADKDKVIQQYTDFCNIVKNWKKQFAEME